MARMTQKTKENMFGAFTIDELNAKKKYVFEFDGNELNCLIAGLHHSLSFLDKQMKDRTKRKAYEKAYKRVSNLITFFKNAY